MGSVVAFLAYVEAVSVVTVAVIVAVVLIALALVLPVPVAVPVVAVDDAEDEAKPEPDERPSSVDQLSVPSKSLKESEQRAASFYSRHILLASPILLPDPTDWSAPPNVLPPSRFSASRPFSPFCFSPRSKPRVLGVPRWEPPCSGLQ